MLVLREAKAKAKDKVQKTKCATDPTTLESKDSGIEQWTITVYAGQHQ